jgi:predicted Zn-dependent protease
MRQCFPGGFILALAFLGAIHGQPSLSEKSSVAKQAMARGDFERAANIYEELVQALPDNPGLVLNLGLAHYSAKQYEAALSNFQQVLRIDPKNNPARLFIGIIYLKRGEAGKALAPLEEFLKADPTNNTARLELADAYLSLGRFEPAAVHFGKLAEADPGNSKAWYGLGLSHAALARNYSGELEAAAPDSAWALAAAGYWRMEQQQYRTALTFFRRALEADPALPGVHRAAGAVYRVMDHPDWAEVEEKREGELPATDCKQRPAACEFIAGRYAQAARIAGRTQTPEALFWRIRAHQEIARQSFERLAGLPPNGEIHQYRADRYGRQGRHADAAGEWAAALRFEPGLPRLKKELARSLWLSRNWEAALPLLQQLVENEPTSPQLRFQLGDTLLELRGPEAALPWLTAAVEAAPDLLPARVSLARAFARAGQPEKALPHLEASLAIDDDGDLYQQMARAYDAVGKTEQAEAARRRYEEIRKKADAAQADLPRP